MKKKNSFESIGFPKVRSIQPKLLADDIFPYIPGDEKNMKVWDDLFKNLHDELKKEFDAKGIPMPTITIDHTAGPITYGVKTVDENGNTLHTLIENKNGKD